MFRLGTYIITLCWLCLVPLRSAQALVLSQQDYLYRVWSVEAGLPQISVTAIVQDPQGFLWLGSQNGLARFDGLQFDVFNTANTAEMSSNLITALHFDQQGRLWIGSVNGLMRYQDGQFNRLDKEAPLQGAITGFAELADGTMYIGGNRLYRWQQQQLQQVPAHQGPVFQLFQHHDILYIGAQDGFASLEQGHYQWYGKPDALPTMQISELAWHDGHLYLGTTAGLYRWVNQSWQPVELPEQGSEARIELLYTDAQQRLWVSNYSNTYLIERGQVQRADYVKGKHQDFVWVESMLQDKHHNLWFGSRSHGLKRLRKPPTQRFSKAQGIPDPYVWALEAWQQHVLVGTSAGLSLLQYGKFQPLSANQYLPNPFVYSLLSDGDALWVGTRAGLSRLDRQTLAWQRNYDNISHLLVTTMARKGERLWVGTNGGLYYLQHDELRQDVLPAQLQTAKVRIVLPDQQNRLWIGTENGLYLGDDSGFTPVLDTPLSGSFISVIKQFADGNLLIGSFDQGFIYGQPGAWHWFNQRSGLPGNGVMHVEKIDNQLLISNFQGFYRLSYPALAQGNIEQLYMLVDDRRPEAETDSHRCCNGAGSSKGLVHQGRVWYPTLDGVVSLPLQQLIHHSAMPEPVITAVIAADQQYLQQDISLPPEARDWRIRFTAPFFLQASSLEFRYQLQGYDKDWIYAFNRREAFYTNLPAGAYRFMLQVRVAGDYRWSDTVELSVQLTPYWYQTWLARSLFMLLVVLALWGLYRWRLSALAKAQLRLERQVAERTQALHEANQKLQQQSMQDALTGLYNRHYVNSNMRQILARAERANEPLTLALLDLDHFKKVNDKLGHQVGDAILRQVADIVRQNCRSTDHLVRWGGEEFLLILEHSADVPQMLQRLLAAMRSQPWPYSQVFSRLTGSVGAVSFAPAADWQQQLQLADQALYWVKQHGRDGYLLLEHGEQAATDADFSSLLQQLPVHSNKTAELSPH